MSYNFLVDIVSLNRPTPINKQDGDVNHVFVRQTDGQ